MTVEGYFGTMAETTSNYSRDISKFPIIICTIQIETIGKTDDETNPPRGGDSGRFFLGCKYSRWGGWRGDCSFRV